MAAELDFDSYRNFSSGLGSSPMNQDDWEDYFSHLMLDGVLAGMPYGVTAVADELKPGGDSSGMQVRVASGRALMLGHLGRVTSQKTLAISAQHATLNRYDVVVLRLDRTNKKIKLAIVEGAPHASPAIPALTRNSSVWETMLGIVLVKSTSNGGGTIAVGDVTDRRQFAVPDSRGMPSCRYRLTTNAATTGSGGGVELVVTFDDAGKTYDTGFFRGGTSGVESGRFYARRDCIVDLFACVRWQANTGGLRRMRFIKSGATTVGRADVPPVTSGGETVQELRATGVSLTAGQYIELGIFQNSGSILNAEAADDYATVFEMKMVRAR